MSHYSVVSSFFYRTVESKPLLVLQIFSLFYFAIFIHKAILNRNLFGTYYHEGVEKKKSAKFQSRLDQIRLLVQYSLLRNKPIFSIVFLKSAALPFLIHYCELQREDCWPRSMADLALGKGVPRKSLKLNIKTNKQNETWFVWLRTIRVQKDLHFLELQTEEKAELLFFTYFFIRVASIWRTKKTLRSILRSFWGFYKT